MLRFKKEVFWKIDKKKGKMGGIGGGLFFEEVWGREIQEGSFLRGK